MGYGSALAPSFTPVLEVAQIVFARADIPQTQFATVGALIAGTVLRVWPASGSGLEEGIWELYFQYQNEAGGRRAVEYQVRDASGSSIWAFRIQTIAAQITHVYRFRFAMKSGWTTALVASDGQGAGDTSSGALGGWAIVA
jgi:hypothetical protein